MFLFATMLIAQQKDSLLKKLKAYELQGDFTEQYIDDLVALARTYRFRNPDSLQLFATKALVKSENLKYAKGKAMSILRLGDYYSDIGNSKLAFENYEKAKEIAFSKNEFEVQVEILKSQAIQSVFSGKVKDAVTTYYEGISIASKQSLFEPEARLRHNLGFFYWTNKLFDEAEKEYLIADSLWILLRDNENAAATASNIALNAIDKKDYNHAEKYANLSIDILKEKGQPLWLSRAYRVKSKLFLSQKLNDEALVFLKKSEELLRHLKNPRDMLEINTLYSSIYLYMNELDKADEKVKSAIIVAEQLKDSKSLVECYQNLEEIERKKGNIEKAFLYLEKSQLLKDTLGKETADNNLKLLKAKLDFESTQAHLVEENFKKLERQKILTAASIGLMILLSIIIFLIVRNSKTEKKLNGELKHLNDSKNRVFATIGHDLKTPIGTLQELLSLYNDKNITVKEFKNITPRLKANVDRSAFSLNNLLFWAQAQMKVIKTVPEKINLKNAANNVCKLYDEQIANKNIEIECKIPKSTLVYIDQEHLNIILRNIISNAIKYSSQNQKIKFNVHEDSQIIKISICDEGIGMNQDLINNILLSKSLVSNLETKNEKGPGLGLGISKELLAQNNGILEIDSKPKCGSCFHITLPKS